MNKYKNEVKRKSEGTIISKKLETIRGKLKGFEYLSLSSFDNKQIDLKEYFIKMDVSKIIFLENNLNEERFMTDPFLNHHRDYYSDTDLTPKESQNYEYEKTSPSLSINDFEFIRLINRGAFGRVWLVKRKSTNDLYAMKIVNILDHIINKKDTKLLEAESKILDVISSQFVVKALFQFTHETFLCFVMEYMTGGDFGYLLTEYKCLDEDVARFYIAELVLAIDSLHSVSIIHRDLKPDNILLEANGHIKLTDFGLSQHGTINLAKIPDSGLFIKNKKEHLHLDLNITNESQDIYFKNGERQNLNIKLSQIYNQIEFKDEESSLKNAKLAGPLKPSLNKFSTLCNSLNRKQRILGTPDYIAPEILNGTHNGMNSPSVDWWALGVMIFEFIVGIPPFNDQTPKEIFENILNLAIPWDQINIGEEENFMSEEAADLIKRMLVLNPEERITKNGSAELKKYKFFKGFV